MELVKKYFPWLTTIQFEQLSNLYPLYADWNKKINVISRKDIEHFYIHHVLHSLTPSFIVKFKKDTSILDVGTGGGFPGIPLAICFPESNFILVDSIGKKAKVVNEISKSLNLKNVEVINSRAEKVEANFDFIISRAVSKLPVLMSWIGGKIKPNGFNSISNGVIYLKGGEFYEELLKLNYNYKIYEIRDYLSEPYFDSKKIIHIYR